MYLPWSSLGSQSLSNHAFNSFQWRSWRGVELTNRMWLSVCTLIDNDTRHHWSKCCGFTRRSRKWVSRARAEKGTAWHIDASSVVWTLIDNGKLANQIARLVAIVVKIPFTSPFLAQNPSLIPTQPRSQSLSSSCPPNREKMREPGKEVGSHFFLCSCFPVPVGDKSHLPSEWEYTEITLAILPLQAPLERNQFLNHGRLLTGLCTSSNFRKIKMLIYTNPLNIAKIQCYVIVFRGNALDQ